MIKKSHESAVSPIIGVILMVAICVILSAVFGTLALGMVSDMPDSRSVAVTVKHLPDGSHQLVYYGGADQDRLVSLTYNNPDGTPAPVWIPTGLGDSRTMAAGLYHIVVTAHFTGNNDQVVVDVMV